MKKIIKKICILGLFLTLNFNFAVYADIQNPILETINLENYLSQETSLPNDVSKSSMSNQSNSTTFSDIGGHWAESKINEAVKIGFVSGYKDGTFKPDKTVTRAEFATLLNNAMKVKNTAQIKFSDIKESDWFYSQVQKSIAVGFFSGYENNTFKPNNPITRQEVAKVISGTITSGDVDGNGASELKDYNSIPDWAKESVNIAYNKCYIKGYPNNMYVPAKSLTRAESVKIICEILNNENIELGFNITNNGESYNGAVVVGNLNILNTVGSGKIYINNVTILGDINILAENLDSVVLTDVKVRNIVVNGDNNPVKITCNNNIYVESVKLSADAKVEKLGTNINIKNTVTQ